MSNYSSVNVVTISNADIPNLIPNGDVVVECHSEVAVPMAGYCSIYATASRDFKFVRKLIRVKLIRVAIPQDMILDKYSEPRIQVGPKSGKGYEVHLAEPFQDGPFGKYYQELFDAAGKAFDEWKNG